MAHRIRWYPNSGLGDNWTAAEISDLGAGFATWETVRTWDDEQLLETVQEASSGSGVVNVIKTPMAPNVFGIASCASNSINLNSGIIDPDIRRNVATHEMGHVLGLAHTGDDASRDGDNPATMSTPSCQPTSANGFVLSQDYSQDDEAAVIRRLDTASPPSMHANQSFERGTKYWGKTAGSSWTHFTSGGFDGTDYIRWQPAAESDYVFQTVDVTHKSTESWALAFDARINHRRVGATQAGDIKFELVVREIEYTGTCSAFLSGSNEHNRGLTSTGWQVVKTTGWIPINATWGWDTTGIYAVSSNWEGLMVRVRVKSGVRNNNGTGGLGFIRLDNMRARQTCC